MEGATKEVPSGRRQPAEGRLRQDSGRRPLLSGSSFGLALRLWRLASVIDHIDGNRANNAIANLR